MSNNSCTASTTGTAHTWSAFHWLMNKRKSTTIITEMHVWNDVEDEEEDRDPAYHDLEEVISNQPTHRTRKSLFASVPAIPARQTRTSQFTPVPAIWTALLSHTTASSSSTSSTTTTMNPRFQLSARAAQHKKMRKRASTKKAAHTVYSSVATTTTTTTKRSKQQKAAAAADLSALVMLDEHHAFINPDSDDDGGSDGGSDGDGISSAAKKASPYDSGIESAESSDAESSSTSTSTSTTSTNQARAPTDHCFSKRRRASVREIAYRWGISVKDAAELAANFESAQGQPALPNRATFASSQEQAKFFGNKVQVGHNSIWNV